MSRKCLLMLASTDKYIATTIEKLASGTDVQSLLISDDPTYLSHFKNIFEELWENGIDATDIIRDIEEGKETDVELINAKHYVNEILEEISSMKHRAKQQGYDMP
jgi:two-component system, OmpR family, sensor histidine kinase VicK